MSVQEIPLAQLRPDQFIRDQIEAIRASVGSEIAISALSGGVDSAVVTLLAHRALGAQLKTYFVENGLMREGEGRRIADLFHSLGVPIEIV
ncbi:MAG: ExsB family transcriptional regulator, partial [Kiritimatiellae bacterium]|nr:ExsB family transcriptional regulator [Kiritimatiellia bacterium]